MAISASSYGVGNRIYKGGTNAPTRGTVDPMGYLDRELNKPSQSRSGLAQAALRRMRGQAPAGSPFGGGSRPQQQGGFNMGDFTKPAGSSLVERSGRTAGIGAANRPIDPGFNMQPPGLSMSPIGKIQAPKLSNPGLAANGGTGLPFDPDAADAQADLLGRNNQFELEYGRAIQDLERQYTGNKRQIDETRPLEERDTLENWAGRGLAYSSGYADDFGSMQRNFANMLAELEQGRGEGMADLLRQRGMWNQESAAMLQNIQQAAARRAAERAAELELGVTPPPPVPEGGLPTPTVPADPGLQPRPGDFGASPAPQLPPSTVPQLPPLLPGGPPPRPQAPVNPVSPFLPAPAPAPVAPPRDNSQVPVDGRRPGGPIANRPAPSPAKKPAPSPRPTPRAPVPSNIKIPPALAAIISGNRRRTYQPKPSRYGGSNSPIQKAAARRRGR